MPRSRNGPARNRRRLGQGEKTIGFKVLVHDQENVGIFSLVKLAKGSALDIPMLGQSRRGHDSHRWKRGRPQKAMAYPTLTTQTRTEFSLQRA